MKTIHIAFSTLQGHTPIPDPTGDYAVADLTEGTLRKECEARANSDCDLAKVWVDSYHLPLGTFPV